MAYTVYDSQDSFEQLAGVLAFNLSSLGMTRECMKRVKSAADLPVLTDALDRFSMALHAQAIMMNAMSDFAATVQAALYEIDSAAPDEKPNDSSTPTGGAKADASTRLATAAAALADALKAK